MAENGGDIDTITAQAAADLSGKQYHLMRLSGAGLCNVASHAAGAAGTLFGVLQNKPTSGHAATLAYEGESKVVAGGNISANAYITTNGSGRATAASSGNMVAGIALEAAAADGDVIRCLLRQPFPLPR